MEALTLEKIRNVIREKKSKMALDKVRELLKKKEENKNALAVIPIKREKKCQDMKCLVSIILPTYNRGEKCVNVIKDVLDQKYKNIELIIVNDGSSNENSEMIENFIQIVSDNRIKYIKHENIGMSASLNVGLKNVSGDYITWISDDNKLHNDYIEKLINPESDFTYSNYNILINDNIYLMKNRHNDAKDLIDNFRGMASFLWKKELTDKIGGFNVSLSKTVNDYDYEIRTFLATSDISHIEDAVIDFYQGLGTQSTNNYTNMKKDHKLVQNFYNIYLDKMRDKDVQILISEKQSEIFFKDFSKDIAKINICEDIDDLEYNADILFVPNKYRELVDNLLIHPITKNIKKSTTELYREDVTDKEVKVEIFFGKTSYKTIRYMNFSMKSGYLKFYQNKMQNYLNCMRQNYDVDISGMDIDELLFNKTCSESNFNAIKKLLVLNNDWLYILDELSYPHMLSIYSMNEESKKFIRDFLENSNYIVYFSELFENENMGTIGNSMNNIDFSLSFFKNSKLNVLCNSNNINILKKYNITNVVYFPPLGYSEINGITPLDFKEIKNVDILFMGSVGKGIFDHRTKYIDILEKFSRKNNYNFECYDFSLFDEQKDRKLSDTKIVVHIPSFSNLQTFPWAKTAELMAKKIFFIIEVNSEMYIRGLSNIVASYDPEIPDDFLGKIKYYLENEEERNKHIDKCYKYIRFNCDMDKFIGNLL